MKGADSGVQKSWDKTAAVILSGLLQGVPINPTGWHHPVGCFSAGGEGTTDTVTCGGMKFSYNNGHVSEAVSTQGETICGCRQTLKFKGPKVFTPVVNFPCVPLPHLNLTSLAFLNVFVWDGPIIM